MAVLLPLSTSSPLSLSLSLFSLLSRAARRPALVRSTRRERRWNLAGRLALHGALVALAGLSAPAWANTGNGTSGAPGNTTCQLHWQVAQIAQAAAGSQGLDVRVSFDAGNRSSTHLRLAGGWAAVEPQGDSAARLQPVADDPQLRQVSHAPGERVQLRWRFTPARGTQAGGALLTERWLAFTGGTVLPWPDELAGQPQVPVCVEVAPPAAGTQLLSSLGHVRPGSSQWTAELGQAQMQRTLFAAGAWQWRDVPLPGQTLTVAMPDPAGFSFGIDTLAKAVAADVQALRQPWGAPESPPLLLLMLPGGQVPAGLALHQAVVVQAPPAMPLPSESFDELLAAQWHRSWLPERLGPMAHYGRGDAALRAWFTEGLADYLSHRWLLREGRWTPTDYANALNLKIARYQSLPDATANNLLVATGQAGPEALAVLPAARGEFLALAWQQALRRAGRPGLEPLLYGLQVPSAQARAEGPTSAPLATHRLLAALRRSLGDQALQMLNQHVEDGAAFSFGPQSLGPCFQGGAGSAGPVVYRPQDQALNHGDCQAWLSGGPVTTALTGDPGSAGGAGLAAAGAAGATLLAAASPPSATRQVCRNVTVKPSAKAGQRGRATKASTQRVCRTITVPAASDTRLAAAPQRGSNQAQAVARPGSKAAKAGAKNSAKSGGAKAGNKPSSKPGAKAAAKSSTKPAAASGNKARASGNAKPAAKPQPKPKPATQR